MPRKVGYSKGPLLRPQEASQRAVQIAVDMAVMNVQYMNTVGQFIGRGELFHLQMHLLYSLIDIMGATADADPFTVLGIAKTYFEALERERHAKNQ